MKIFDWVQGKFNGKQGTKKSNPFSACNHKQQEPQKEEFGDWPHGLLAVGTFGNYDPKQVPETTLDHHLHENTSSSQDHPQDLLTPEEVQKLHNELKSLFHNTSTADHKLELTRNLDNLDEFFDCCPPRLEGDQLNNDAFAEESMNEKDGRLKRSTSVVHSRGKDVCSDNNKKSAINKRSFSFVLKKMFVCRGGFALNTPLRDPLPDSRIEKILRAMVHKKVYPQSSSNPTLLKKKYLGTRHMATSEDEEVNDKLGNDGSKWVKTDSEYIVLEI